MALSKRQKIWADKVNPDAFYSIDDAIKLAKELATSKFDETVEMSFNLGVDPKHADQTVRAMTSFKGNDAKSKIGYGDT